MDWLLLRTAGKKQAIAADTLGRKMRPERSLMITIDLHYVDELILVREQQHGGERGAPQIQDGHRIGTSINRSCIVMLSALLQAYVEEVFQDAARRVLPALRNDPAVFERYWNQVRNWGNPSDQNIINLFMRLGAPDIFDGLSWQRTPTAAVKRNLGQLNQIRNRIAHGAAQLTLDGRPYSLSLAAVKSFRNHVASFGGRFSDHVEYLLPSR